MLPGNRQRDSSDYAHNLHKGALWATAPSGRHKGVLNGALALERGLQTRWSGAVLMGRPLAKSRWHRVPASPSSDPD